MLMRTSTIQTLMATAVCGMAALGASAAVTGQWDFNGSFAATVGTDLQPQGIAVSQSSFGTTTSFGIADIGGQVAQILKFPKMPTSADGYKMFPGAAANGSSGASDVNQYSLLMDVLFPSSSTGFRALFQTSADNSNDADWFVNGGNGIGIAGQYSGNLTPDAWHRIALVVDLEQTDATKKYQNFIDGTFVGYSDLSTEGNPGGRFAVWSTASGNPSWLFSDNDGETGLGYVNSVQFRDYAMSSAEIAALGGATAEGITVPEPTSAMLLGVAGVLWLLRSRRAC